MPTSAILYAPYGDSVFVVEDVTGPKGQRYLGVRQQFVKLGASRGDQVAARDVLEHIADEDRFLKTMLYHLAPGGTVVVNVPAGHWAFSNYDSAAGHVRRYSLETLKNPAGRNNLEVREWSYWGLPMVPMLVLRKLSLRGKSDQREIITAGFDSRTPAINKILGEVSRWEPIPQHLLGTSLMVVFQAADGSQLSAR